MAIYIKKSGAWKLVSAISIKKSGAWKLSSGIGIKKNNTWKLANGTLTLPTGEDLSASSSPATAIAGSIAGAGEAKTANLTVTAAGGTPPYSYTWSKVSGGGSSFTRDGGSTNVVAWRATFTTPASYVENWKCVVADSAGASVEVAVAVTLESTAGAVLTVDFSQIDVIGYSGGVQTQWGSSVSGGNGSYTYTWSSNFGLTPGVFGDPSKSYYNNTSGASFTGSITLNVSDTSGKTGSKTKSMTVN